MLSNKILSFVALELATKNILVAQRLDGGISLCAVGHVHETEALGLVGVAVRDNACGIDDAISLKLLAKPVLREIVAQVAHINFNGAGRGVRRRGGV